MHLHIISIMTLALCGSPATFADAQQEWRGTGEFTSNAFDFDAIAEDDAQPQGHAYGHFKDRPADITAPIPEPAEWALMATGLLLLSAAAVRRSVN